MCTQGREEIKEIWYLGVFLDQLSKTYQWSKSKPCDAHAQNLDFSQEFTIEVNLEYAWSYKKGDPWNELSLL